MEYRRAIVRNRITLVLMTVVAAVVCTRRAESTMMAPDTALWREDSQYHTLLDFVNWTTASADAHLTFFDASGKSIADRHFTFEPQTSRTVTVASLGIMSPSAAPGLLTMETTGAQ